MKVGLQDIITIVIIFQLLVFTIFLFVKKTNRYSNYLLGIQLFSQAAGIFTSFCFAQTEYFYNNFPYLFFIGYPFMFLWGPTFYLYVRSAAFSDFRLRGKHLIHFVPFAVIYILLLTTYFGLSFEEQRGLLTSRNHLIFEHNLYLDIFVRSQVLFYIILSISVLFSAGKKLKENYSSVTQTNLSWIKFLVTGFTAAYLLTIPLIVYYYIFQIFSPFFVLITMLPYFIFFNIIFFKAWNHPELFSGIEENLKYKSSKLTPGEAENVLLKLNEIMRINKPFLNPDLTLNRLAENLDLSPRILSQVINEYFNQNFHDYINRLRIEESKKVLANPANNKTILEILYEVGFNTKSAYNVAFKRSTGFTPTEYRKRFRKECDSESEMQP
ncbi:MAG: AraC family transcriptional regulator [Ignavibacteriaceae bacterium]